MGCVLSSEAIEADLEHAPPDFDRTADPKRTYMHQADFSCRFEAAIFGEIFKQNSSIVPGRFGLPPLGQDKDKYEDGYDMFLIRPYTQMPIYADVAYELLSAEFPPLQSQDVSLLVKYVYLNKNRPDVMTAKDFIRLAYLCYRFFEIYSTPTLALFYFLDDYRSGFVSVKKLQYIMAMHFKISRPQKAIFRTQHSHCSVDEFIQAAKSVQRQSPDTLADIFDRIPASNIKCLDQTLHSLTSWEREFSDVSVGKEKAAKIRRLKRRAAELKWSQNDLDDAIQRATKTQNWEEAGDAMSDQMWQ